MTRTRLTPYLAFALLLLLLITGSLVVQTAGHMLGVSLVRYSLWIALLPALWLTYGYCFAPTRKDVGIAFMLAAILALLGMLSPYLPDFTSDGMGYQQPSAEAIMNGWDPFGPDVAMLWQNIYPSGVWAVEASLACLYGSVEATRMIQVWWLFIALPIFLAGLSCGRSPLAAGQVFLAVLMVLSPVVLNQALTHYVDALVYLSGITFIGGLLMYGYSRCHNVASALIMAASVIFITNAKLSGIYHAVTLCSSAVLFLGIRSKRFPWKIAVFLFATGLFAALIVGYRPYVTSFIKYGPSLFPPKNGTVISDQSNTEEFSGVQRPNTFDALPQFERFSYSLFSVDGGAPHEPAQLKWPWTIGPTEWKFSGDPDARTGGFGPLFALGFLASMGLFAHALIRKLPLDKPFIALGATCLLFSAFFPQSWWARYVPFAYAVPFLLLLSVPAQGKVMRYGVVAVSIIFAVNSAMAASAAVSLFHSNQTHFMEMAGLLRRQPQGSVYLVPPVANYKKYNDAYMPLQRRLQEQGVATTLKVGAPCPRMAGRIAEYSICY